jgi:hypothetical protein
MIDGPFNHHWAMSLDVDPRNAVTAHAFRPFGCAEIEFGQVRLTVPVGKSGHVLSLSYLRLKAHSYVEESYDFKIDADLKDIRVEPEVRVGTVRWEGRWLDWAVLLDLQLEARVGHGIKIQAGLDNPLSLGLAKEHSPCPVRVSLGMGYRVTQALAWGMEVRKQSGLPTSVSTGIEWALGGPIALRTGMRTYPEELAVGVGIGLGRFVLDVSTSLNLELGTTHQVGATFVWG